MLLRRDSYTLLNSGFLIHDKGNIRKVYFFLFIEITLLLPLYKKLTKGYSSSTNSHKITE